MAQQKFAQVRVLFCTGIGGQPLIGEPKNVKLYGNIVIKALSDLPILGFFFVFYNNITV